MKTLRRDNVVERREKMGKNLKGFWAATGWRMVFILTALCYFLAWMRHNAGYGWFDLVTIYICLAIVGGAYAMLLIHYLAGTRPAPYSLYIPGVRNFDGTYPNSPSNEEKQQ